MGYDDNDSDSDNDNDNDNDDDGNDNDNDNNDNEEEEEEDDDDDTLFNGIKFGYYHWFQSVPLTCVVIFNNSVHVLVLVLNFFPSKKK